MTFNLRTSRVWGGSDPIPSQDDLEPLPPSTVSGTTNPALEPIVIPLLHIVLMTPNIKDATFLSPSKRENWRKSEEQGGERERIGEREQGARGERENHKPSKLSRQNRGSRVLSQNMPPIDQISQSIDLDFWDPHN